jgi:hypothetical protein
MLADKSLELQVGRRSDRGCVNIEVLRDGAPVACTRASRGLSGTKLTECHSPLFFTVEQAQQTLLYLNCDVVETFTLLKA